MILHEAKEDVSDGIFIRFCTDGSLFNLRRLLAKTDYWGVTIELLFAEDCALLPTQRLHFSINCFSSAAKGFGLTIRLKKTEVTFQPPPRGLYTPPQICIDGTTLNAMDYFSYLESVISNDATVNNDLDNQLSKRSSSFGRLSKCVWKNHSNAVGLPQRCRSPGAGLLEQ